MTAASAVSKQLAAEFLRAKWVIFNVGSQIGAEAWLPLMRVRSLQDGENFSFVGCEMWSEV
jgi:hypothetical protein